MSESGMRQLKAIMFTDIKGFSAMMGADEKRTIRLVSEHREIVRDILPKHAGKEHTTVGDAFVVLFDSAVNAVQCAAEIQGRFREINTERPEDEQVWIRIGIHLGDIVLQDGDIYGDGVNIAARVEPQADPGGICITQDVYLQVHNKVGIKALSIGRKELKNITEAPELYRLLLEGEPDPDEGAPGAAACATAPVWKLALWYAVTLPFAFSFLALALLVSDGPRMLLAACHLPEDWPPALGIAVALLISGGLALAAFSAQRFWTRGARNRWLHGPLFAVFPLSGLLMVLYHYLTLDGQMESYLTSVRSYSTITAPQSDKMAGLVSGSLAQFLNSAALDQMIVAVLGLILLFGCMFIRPEGDRQPGAWKKWLVIPGGILLIVVVERSLPHVFWFMGPGRFVIYLLWALFAIPLLRARNPRVLGVLPAWWALLAGAVTVMALVNVHVLMGYVEAFHFHGMVPLEDRPGLFDRVIIPAMNTGDGTQLLVLLALFGATVAVARRALPVRGTGSKPIEHGVVGLVIVVATGLPLVVTPKAMSRWEQQWLPIQLTQMRPGAMQPGEDPSFYVDRKPRSLSAARKGLFEALTGENREDFTVDKTSQALAGHEACREILDATLQAEEEAAPARCVTAIEARLACETLGLRLPTPEEWKAALGGVPIDTGGPQSPLVREPFAEWTMRLVHGTPTFQVSGTEGTDGAPTQLEPDGFSDKVGFRCAISFED